MEGVSSRLIFNMMKNSNKIICSKEELPVISGLFKPGIVLMMGAGDIDTLVEPVKKQLLKYGAS
jgi:UDP-N-acetylmuramate--alanine ligase